MHGGDNGMTAWSGRHWTGLTLLAASLLLAAPLWLVWAPAMPDYPAHLASFALIAGAPSRYYHLHWSFSPNLASELIVPWLAHLTGVAIAAKLFLTAGVLLWIWGPGAVHRALYGRTGIAPLFGAFFAANANFVWGFFNYYVSAGLAMALFAGWIASASRNDPWRIGAFTLGVTLLYFCHLFAAAALLLMLTGYELQAWRLNAEPPSALGRRGATLALLYLPAALAFLLLKPHGLDEGGLHFNLLDTLADRLESLILHSFDDPAYVLPALLFAGLGLGLALRKARLHSAMTIVLMLLGAGALLAPEWAMGGWAVHLRLPALFAALLFASAEIRLPAPLRHGLALTALALIAWNAAMLTRDWRHYDVQFRDFRDHLDEIPRGTKLLLVLDGDALGERPDQPYWHLAELAVPTRDAFTPLMFTTKGQHVVQVNPPYDRLAAASAQQGSPPDVDELGFLARGQTDQDEDIADIFPYLIGFQCHFDMALVIHPGGARTPVPANLHLRTRHSFYTLYDIVPDGYCRT